MTTKKLPKRLTRDDILSRNAKKYLKSREVFVEEWEGSVFVRELTAGEQRRRAEMSKDSDDAATRMLTVCVVDENGDQLFEEKDAEELQNQGGRVLKTILDAITEINGVTAEMIEETRKNLQSVPSGNSSSG